MKKTLFSISSLDTDLATLFLRLIVGGMFIYYGIQKIADYDKIALMFTDIIGIGAKLSFNLVIFAEFFCGLLIAIGCFTRFAIIPICFTMIIAYFVAHAKDPFLMKQLPFVYLLLCIPVFILGSGKYSLDYLVFKKGRN